GDARAGRPDAGRHPPRAAPRHGALPRRLLHLPGDGHPAQRRARRRPDRGPRIARLPPGALEGRASDPVRRPAAAGSARRLDLPGPPRRPARPALKYDAVVIGVGLAGLVAAIRVAERGKRVLVVAKGVGSTHLGGATIDVLGYAPEAVEQPLEAV